MARMPYSAASGCCSSTLTLPIFTLPSYSSASSSRSGAIILHGPHHSAQKSTSTGVGDCKTCWAKFSCVSVTTSGEAIHQKTHPKTKRFLRGSSGRDKHHPNDSADREQSGHSCGNDKNLIQRTDRWRGSSTRNLWCCRCGGS